MAPDSRYNAAPRWLHWLTAGLVAVIIDKVNHWGLCALLVLMPITGFSRRTRGLSRCFRV